MEREKNLLTALGQRGVLPKHEFRALRAWLSTFFPYQLRWLLEPARFAICLKGRQIGMSHTTAASAVLWAAMLAETTMIISTDLDTAGEVIEMARRHAAVLVKLGSNFAKCRQRGNALLFENGGRIMARPATSAARGFSGNIFLDEFAYVEDPESVWDQAAAVALHGSSKIRVSSTPNGVGNAFHRLWSNPESNKGWKKHEVDLRKAQAQGLPLTDETCWAVAKGDQRIFGQMFLCSFLDGDEQYIPTPLVEAAVRDDVSVLYGEYFAGFDVGYKNDRSVLVVLRQTQELNPADGRIYPRLWVQSVEDIGERTDWPGQKRRIFEKFGEFPIRKLCVDETGAGFGMVRELEQRIGQHKVEGFVFGLQSKAILATDMYQAFATDMIRIPNDPDLIRDLLSIRRIITESGNVKYDAPRTVEGHADRAWALALAIQACASKPARRVERGPGDFRNT